MIVKDGVTALNPPLVDKSCLKYLCRICPSAAVCVGSRAAQARVPPQRARKNEGGGFTAGLRQQRELRVVVRERR